MVIISDILNIISVVALLILIVLCITTNYYIKALELTIKELKSKVQRLNVIIIILALASKGGKLDNKQVKEISFQKKLKLAK